MEEKMKDLPTTKKEFYKKGLKAAKKAISKTSKFKIKNRKVLSKGKSSTLDLRRENAEYKSRYFKTKEVIDTNFLFN